MRFKKINNIKVRDLNFKNPYKLPVYSNTTGDNSFVLGLISGIRNAGKSTLANYLSGLNLRVNHRGFIRPVA